MRARGDRLVRLIAALASVVLLIGMGIGPAGTAVADPVLGPPPTSVSVSQRATMAILTWPADAAVTGYAVDFGTDPAFVGARHLTVDDSVAVLTGLLPETAYVAHVAALDATTGATGAWGPTISFTTGALEYALPAPVVTLSTPTTTSVAAEWTAAAPKLHYQAALGEHVTALSTAKDAGTHLAAGFDNLKKSTTYYVSVRALDAAGRQVTAWSDPVAIKTPEDLPLTVASFNIKCNSCRKKGEKSWAQRKAAVVRTVLSQSPDVIGLQEASQGRMPGRRVAQYQDLVNGLGAPYAVTVNHDVGGGAGLDDRIVYNTKTVKLLKTGAVKLPKSGTTRYVAWATFVHLGTGKKFLFADTHLTPGKSKNSVRNRQTRAIISTLNRLSDDQRVPAILVGDFNMFKWMGSGGYKPYDMLVSAGYLDPLGNTYRSHSAASTAFVEKRINTNFSTYNDFRRSAPGFSYDNGTQLDFIFVTKMRVTEWETVVDVDSQGRFVGTIPSDHNMVRATVLLP